MHFDWTINVGTVSAVCTLIGTVWNYGRKILSYLQEISWEHQIMWKQFAMDHPESVVDMRRGLILKRASDGVRSWALVFALLGLSAAVPVAAQGFPTVAPPVLYAAIDAPLVGSAAHFILSGWAINCASGQQPTNLRLGYIDVNLRLHQVPVTVYWRGSRPDVAAAVGSNCGGVPYVAGVSPWLGWSMYANAALPVGSYWVEILVDDIDFGQASHTLVPTAGAAVWMTVQ